MDNYIKREGIKRAGISEADSEDHRFPFTPLKYSMATVTDK
jgi:hypothetical protein